MPVIQQLTNEGCEVIIACNPHQKAVLQAEFPHLTYHDLQGYGIRYAKNRWITIGRMLWQVPKMFIRVKKEHRWLQDFLSKNRVDAIISDNRFGFYAEGIPSIFITHQLAVRTGLGKWMDSRAQDRNYAMINRFTEVWVPDNGEGYSIAGSLSKPAQLPQPPVKYMGGISRFELCVKDSSAIELNQATAISSKRIDLLIILSGPEPQRTIFEQLLTKQLADYKGESVLVRALPGEFEAQNTKGEKILPNVTSYNHVPAKMLNQLVCDAKLVISRSGYTTVMDLLKTKKKSILVPTPGQAEQEYLAVHLEQEQLACTVSQNDFNLQQALDKVEGFPFRITDDDMQHYKSVINGFVQSLRSTRQ